MDRPTIIVVDDDLDTLELYGVLLEHEGYDVLKASTGEQFLSLLIRVAPAAIILDLGLPDVGGIALCRVVRNARRLASVPLIAVTGWTSGPVVEGIAEAAFNEVFIKPLRPAVLLDALRRWVPAASPAHDTASQPFPLSRASRLQHAGPAPERA